MKKIFSIILIAFSFFANAQYSPIYDRVVSNDTTTLYSILKIIDTVNEQTYDSLGLYRTLIDNIEVGAINAIPIDSVTGLQDSITRLSTSVDSIVNGWTIDVVNTDFAPEPFEYYLVDASVEPLTAYLPAYDGTSENEYIISLFKNTHKVTITDGEHNWVVPTLKGFLHIKGSPELNDWVVVEDGRHMWHAEVITSDRDYSDGDGFENNVTYYIKPAVSGSAVLLTLPKPAMYDSSATARATFVLGSAGSFTIVRSDGGYIGSKLQQTVSTIGKGITIEEYDTIYNIVQDSRPTTESNISFPLYRTNDLSDVGSYYALVQSKDDPRYGTEVLLSTGDVTSLTPVNYVNYISDSGVDFGDVPQSSVTFNVVTYVNTASRPIATYYELYKRTSGGTETLIVQSPSFVISSTIAQLYTINTIFPPTSFDPTDRLVLKVWVYRTNGTQPSYLTTAIEGNQGAYFLRSLPSSSVEHNQLAGRDDIGAHPQIEADIIANTNAIIDYDSLKAISQNTMLVFTRTQLDTLYTKKQYYDYILDIGSSNDTIEIIDDLSWNIYAGDTTAVLNRIKWYNSDNTSQLYFRFNDSILPYDNGIVDVTKANTAVIDRQANSGTFIDQVATFSTSPSAKPITPSDPIYISGSAEIGAVGDSIFTLDFNQAVNITGVTGITFTSDGGALTANSVSSGSGTSEINISLSRTISDTETITFSIAGTNDITGVVGGLAFAGITDSAVVNNSGIPNDYIAYYTFSNDVTDEGGNYNGTNNGATFVNDRHGNINSAISLNGSSYVDISSSIAGVGALNAGTISFWIYVADATPATTGIIYSMASSTGTPILSINHTTTGTLVFFVNDGVNFTSLASPVISDATWYNIIFTQNGTSSALYINGLLTSGTLTGGDATLFYNDIATPDNLLIGVRNYNNLGNTNYFTGILDDIVVYGRVITSQEISKISSN